MPAVQRTSRTIDRQLESNDAAQPEHRLQAATLVHRAVAEQPGIGTEQVAVLLENGLEMSRTGFFLALEEELHVHRWRHVCRAHRIERGEHGDDRTLVVARRAGI